MAKDYKKRNQSNRGSGLIRSVSMLLVAYMLGYFSASFFTFSQVRHWFSHHILSTENGTAVNTAMPQSNLPKPKFEFYTLLSKEQSTHKSKASAPLKPTPAPVKMAKPAFVENKAVNQADAKKNAYLVQVASFRNKQDAEKMKATLIIQDFNASISIAKQKNITWYRVMIGPYKTHKQAEKAQVAVAKSEHVLGMIRKMDA